jgi:hypothetical protein
MGRAATAGAGEAGTDSSPAFPTVLSAALPADGMTAGLTDPESCWGMVSAGAPDLAAVWGEGARDDSTKPGLAASSPTTVEREGSGSAVIDPPAQPTKSNSARPKKIFGREPFLLDRREGLGSGHSSYRRIAADGFIKFIIRQKAKVGFLG